MRPNYASRGTRFSFRIDYVSRPQNCKASVRARFLDCNTSLALQHVLLQVPGHHMTRGHQSYDVDGRSRCE